MEGCGFRPNECIANGCNGGECVSEVVRRALRGEENKSIVEGKRWTGILILVIETHVGGAVIIVRG